MSSVRAHGHPSLPAPVVHAGLSASQSKSHVLAGVQDAYWSDDEAEDAECPLCLEEMDISDLNFKPCVCGYQICRFCWNHIKENLNGRCPACRREYTDEAVQFQAISKEDHKRLTQQKKQRERERKDLDALGRRQLANVRVVQRHVVYVVGIGPRFAKEELIPTLRSNEYFGQYGKISKILLVKRTSGGGTPVVGLYITYHRREDAARCIAAVDGAPSPGGGRDVMRTSYGTTKYCMAFLRGVTCNDHNCMNLHEWGDEKDCFTKEDLTTLKHTMKDTEHRSHAKKADDAVEVLPRAASWGQKPSHSSNSPALHNNTNVANHTPTIPTGPRPTRRGATTTRQSRSTANGMLLDSRQSTRSYHDRKGGSIAGSTKTASQASSSRPATPAASLPQRPATPPDVKVLRQKEAPQPPRSPVSSIAVSSDLGSGSQEPPLSPAARPPSAVPAQSSHLSPVPVPATPAVPPGLSAPPGLPAPGTYSNADASIPSLQISQSTYQMSTAARALLDDVKARRESTIVVANISPFPDFDRTLQTLSGDNGTFGGFSFNLDPKLAAGSNDPDAPLPELEIEANIPFRGRFMDAFPALRTSSMSQPQHPRASMPPPGLGYPHSPNYPIYDPSVMRPPSAVERQPTPSSSYTGSFNPFAESGDDVLQGPRAHHLAKRPSYSLLDDERKMSRFDFARGRKGSTAASSPIHMSSPISASDSHHSFYTAAESNAPGSQAQWPMPHPQDFAYTPLSSEMNSPMQHHPHAYPQPTHQHIRFQPFDNPSTSVSEAQLRELIQSSREKADSMRNIPYDQGLQYQYTPHQSFNDPAIMSARLASPTLPSASPADISYAHSSPADSSVISPQLMKSNFSSLVYSPNNPQSAAVGQINSLGNAHGPLGTAELSRTVTHAPLSTPPSPSPALSSADFPALNADSNIREQQVIAESQLLATDSEAQAKAERKAAKRAVAAERAAQRQKIAQEKAAVRAAEKARIAQEKAAEKEKAAALKLRKEQALQERAEQERLEKERAQKVAAEFEKAEKRKEMEQAAQAEKEAEKEKVTQAKAAKVVRQTAPSGSNKATFERKESSPAIPARQIPPPSRIADSVVQAPILSKMPKKNKPVARTIRIPKEEEPFADEHSTILSASASETPQFSVGKNGTPAETTPNNSRSQSVDRNSLAEPTSLADLFDDIDLRNPSMDLPNHPFFDLSKINPAAKMPLEYGPLVHALSALSVGGGSFANNMPSGSIDNAVSSFQQLLETLTQTISDLLRLLPRTTWDDSSSFDGVLRDMLKGDDFLDDGGDDTVGKEDEVAALTLALERRARWMEVQLSKLEELHRDINTAAVRAVLSFNDSGWDRHGFLPRIGHTLRQFNNIGQIEQNGCMRPMTADELEKELMDVKKEAVSAETKFRETMEKLQAVKPVDIDEF